MPTRWISLAAAVAWAVAMAAAPGCDDQPADLVTTRPAPEAPAQAAPATPATRPEPPAPLAPKALTHLDELEPNIPAPVGKPEDKPLPERVRDEYDKARRLIAQRNYSAAIAALERADSFAPNHPVLLRALGQAYAALPNRGKARENLLAAVGVAGDDLESHLMLGQLAAGRQQNRQAVTHLRTALACSQADPNNPRAAEALLVLGLLLDREGYWTAAYECYERLGDWISAHGRDYVERATLREWVLRPERLLTRRGAILLLLRRPKQALPILERAYGRNRTSGRTAGLLVEALLNLRMHKKAEKVLLEMIDLPSQRRNLPAMLDALCRQSKDRDLPERFWQAVARRNKQDADIAVALARTALQLGWADQAVAVLASVAAEQPNHAGLWRLLGRRLASLGRYDALVAAMDKGLTADPAAVEAMAEVMGEIAEAARQDGAERELAQRVRKSESPNQHALLYLAGLVASAKNKQLLATDLYQRSVEKKPDFAAAQEALLELYLSQDRGDLADRLLDRLAAAPRKTYLPHYLRGKVELRRGNADKAIAALQEAYGLSDNAPAVAVLLAEAYQANKQADAAISLLIDTFREHPDNIQAARKLFDLCLATGKRDHARSLARQLLARHPDNMEVRFMVVRLALVDGKIKEAMVQLNQLVASAPRDAGVQVLFVRTLLGARPGQRPGIVRKQDFDRSSENLNRLVQAQPANREIRLALGELLWAVDMPGKAAGILAPLFEEKPDDEEVFERYVDTLSDANDLVTALAAVDKHLSTQSQDGNRSARIAKLRLLVKAGRGEEAREVGLQWIKQTDDENERQIFRMILLEILQAAEDHPNALAVLNEWLAAQPDDSLRTALEETRLRALGLTGQYDEGLRLVRRKTADDPLSLTGQQLAITAIDRGDCDKAIEILAGCLKRAQACADDLAALATALADLDANGNAAKAAYRKALEKIPPKPTAEIAELVVAKAYDKARQRVAGLAVTANQNVWTTRALHLMALDKSERQAQALALAEKWVADSPGEFEARKLLLGELSEAKKWDQATRLLGRWEADPLFASPTTVSVEDPNDAGETDPAQWLAETAVRVKFAAGKPGEALKRVDEAVRAYPKDAEMLTLRSTILGELGRGDEAEKAMDKALKVAATRDLRYATYLNNMAYLLAVRGRRLGEAESFSRLSRRFRPTEVAYADTFGWVLYKQGRLLQAARVFQELLRRVDTDEAGSSVIFDHAGDAYWRMGWRDRAVELWRKALELGRKAENPIREERELLERAVKKIDAARAAQTPPIAPLGEAAKPSYDLPDRSTQPQTPRFQRW